MNATDTAPVVRDVFDLDDAPRPCPHCGATSGTAALDAKLDRLLGFAGEVREAMEPLRALASDPASIRGIVGAFFGRG